MTNASIIVVCYDAGDDLIACLEALEPDLWTEVVLVDNASSDLSVEAAADRWAGLHVVRSPTNLGFAGGANLGAARARGETLVFLNPDTRPHAADLQMIVEALVESPGVAGPLIKQPFSGACEAGTIVDLSGMPRSLPPGDSRQPMFVKGCCLATNRSCFDQVGGFDERYFMFGEDAEYCWQAMRRGFAVSVVARAVVEHLGGRAAPGGYRSTDRTSGFEISVARVLLRERNTTTMLIACVPALWVPLVLLASLARTVSFGILLARLGAWRGIGGLVVGIGQVVQWVPGTFRRRRRPPVSKSGSLEAWSRVAKRAFLLDHLGAIRGARLVGERSPRVRPLSWSTAVSTKDTGIER